MVCKQVHAAQQPSQHSPVIMNWFVGTGGSQGNIYAIRETVKELNAIYQLIARYYMGLTDMTADEVERNTCRGGADKPAPALLLVAVASHEQVHRKSSVAMASKHNLSAAKEDQA